MDNRNNDELKQKEKSQQQQPQKDENKQVDQQLPKIQEKTKWQLIKKNTIVPTLINYPYMFKLSDSLFKVLKQANPQQFEDISHVPEVFYFKTLRNIKFQAEHTTLKFKTLKKKFQSVEKYIQEFKSFGDQYFYDLAVSYEFIYNQYNMFSRFKSINVSKTVHLEILEDLLIRLRGKMFIAYVMENVQEQNCLDRVIISNQLLSASGYTKEAMQLDYLKYKHVFFEIVNKQFYLKVYVEIGHYVKRMLQKNVQQTPKSQENSHKKNLIVFEDFVYRKKTTQDGQVDEKLSAVIQFYRPHQKITLFEFQIDLQTILQTIPRQKQVHLKQKLQEQIQKQQIQSLSNILQNTSNISTVKNQGQASNFNENNFNIKKQN